MVEFEEGGVAKVVVADAKKHKEGVSTFYKARVPWSVVNGNFIGMKMCPAFKKALGHDIRRGLP